MSDAHPAADELADLQAGLVDADSRSRLTAHVSACNDCTDTVTALQDVTLLLAAEGAEPLIMPPALAGSLDDQMRRLGTERRQGVPSLDEQRSSTERRTPPSRLSRWSRQAMLGAAATVLGVTSVWGIAHLDGGSSSQSDSSASTSADESANGIGGAASPSKDNPGSNPPTRRIRPPPSADQQRPQVVSPRTLAAFASALAKTGRAADSVSVGAATCTIRDDLSGVVEGSDHRVAATPVRWRGHLAVVLVRPAGRRATVVSCETPARRLYSTSY